MKLRSLICVSAVAAASAALALDSGNVFARLKVTSDVENSIIAIPFSGCGEADAKIYVTNLVMTAGLSDDDTLMYNDGSNWYAWEIKNGAWSPVTAATKDGVTIADPSNLKMDCGGACWLIRSSTSNPVYLYGQVNETSPTTVTVSGADSDDKYAYTIIAKPSESTALDLNTWHPTSAATGDLLLVPDSGNAMGQVTYRYNADTPAWETVSQSTTTVTSPRGGTKVITNSTWTAISTSTTIPAGKGVMYGRKGQTSATLAW